MDPADRKRRDEGDEGGGEDGYAVLNDRFKEVVELGGDIEYGYVLEEARECAGKQVCEKAKHGPWFDGWPLWDVLAVKIIPKSPDDPPPESVYGAIRVEFGSEPLDYLFRRKKDEAQRFRKDEHAVSLRLTGPDNHFVLMGYGELAFDFALRFNNDKDIFPALLDSDGDPVGN